MALDDIRIASPCSADWNAMPGDDRVRTCGDCRKRVYNLAAMTRADAEALIASRESLCVRLYRRRDGTVVTADCAPPLRKIRRKVAAGAIAVLAGGCIDDAPEEENVEDDVTVGDDAGETPDTLVPHLTFAQPLLGGTGSRSVDDRSDLSSLFPPPSAAFDDLRESDSASMGALVSLSFDRAPIDADAKHAQLRIARMDAMLEAAGFVPTVGVRSDATASDANQPPIESESTDE